MQTTRELDLPLIAGSQAQKHVTHNEALQKLDVLVQAVVAGQLDVPPPPSGDARGLDPQVWIVGTNATGAWAGRGGRLAAADSGRWSFITPREGWQVFDLQSQTLRRWDGNSWTHADRRQIMLGINGAADELNRLVVHTRAVLLSHDGAAGDGAGGDGDIRLALNREATTDTASLVFQSDHAGEAEIGLSGDEGLSVRVKDGQWRTAMSFTPAGRTKAIEMEVERALVAGNVLSRDRLFIASDYRSPDQAPFADRSDATNLDHIWSDEGSNTWHLCADADYKSDGNATVRAGAFTTSSDYRMKEYIVALSGSHCLEIIGAVEPVSFDWKSDSGMDHEVGVPGFIAHELARDLPQAVKGKMDATDGEGRAVHQSIVHERLIPVLVAAVKTLADRVEALETRR